MEKGSFEGKIALITGSARGIGKRIATELAANGADIALNDIQKENLERAMKDIKKFGGQVKTYPVDITKKSDARTMVDDIISEWDKIDILVNNAGIATPTSFLDLTEEEWNRVIEVNLKGAVIVTQSVLRHMLKRKYGRIVNIASAAGKMGGIATSLAYDVSKAGMIVMTKSLARQFSRYGITVNAVAPSFTDTDMLKDLKVTGRKTELAELNIIQRLATPYDVANAVLFLASDKSSFITGETINVTGGRLMD